MPRGVYDRSKKKSDSPEAPKAPKAKKQAKTAAAVSSPKAKKGGSVAGSPTVDTAIQFASLRDNIATLSRVRVELGNSELGRKVEVEIAQNLSLLTKLRQDVFGKTEDEKVAQSDSTARVGNGTVAPTIPLPTNPMSIPPPPTA